MNKKPTKKLANRALAVVAVTCILGFGIDVFGLVNVALIHGDEYKQKAETQQLSDTTVAATRGVIYDRNMNVLAQSADAWKIYLIPSKIKDDATAKAIAKGLAEILSLDYDTVYASAKKDTSYVVIDSKVEYELKEKVSKFIKENKGYNAIIGIESDTVRYYPYSDFASTVIGFTGTDDVGLSGLEYYYNDYLTGTPGRVITAKNARSDEVSSDFESEYKAEEGYSLVLTIDQVIQYYLDSALSAQVEASDAAYGYGIVMNVKTGAILAMSTQPDFDLNNPYAVVDTDTLEEINKIEDETEKKNALIAARYAQWRNRTVSDSYEPGSVFKVITAAAALEEGVTTADEKFYCNGSIKVADRTYHCAHPEGHGSETFTMALANSCNPVFIAVGERLGSALFYKYFDAFGFTETTGIDLPSESTPIAGVTYYTEDALGKVQLASCAFGQSFQCSPIQIITAVSAIANGGKLMQPYIVDSMLDEDGNTVYNTEPTVKRQVVSEKTADIVSSMMAVAVTDGTAKNAYVAGYRVAGKTGTSQKLTSDGKYIASFIGFAPADDPEIAILIVIDEPKSSYYGGTIAAPVTAEVFEKALVYLGVEPQYTEEELATLGVETPNVLNQNVTNATQTLKKQGFNVKVYGNGKTVISQNPTSDQVLPQNGTVVLYTDSATMNQSVTVPDFSGLTITKANSRAQAAGLNIKISGYTNGSDVVSYKQSVATGTKTAPGTIVTVSFKTTGDVADFAD